MAFHLPSFPLRYNFFVWGHTDTDTKPLSHVCILLTNALSYFLPQVPANLIHNQPHTGLPHTVNHTSVLTVSPHTYPVSHTTLTQSQLHAASTHSAPYHTTYFTHGCLHTPLPITSSPNMVSSPTASLHNSLPHIQPF